MVVVVFSKYFAAKNHLFIAKFDSSIGNSLLFTSYFPFPKPDKRAYWHLIGEIYDNGVVVDSASLGSILVFVVCVLFAVNQ